MYITPKSFENIVQFIGWILDKWSKYTIYANYNVHEAQNYNTQSYITLELYDWHEVTQT